jgi:iron complex transport system ATP-binding protein
MTFEATSLAVRYGRSGRKALDGVNMTVPEGALYAVIGPNGSGKSTLMKALLGLVRPESGEVRIAGKETHTWTRRDLARAVGAVPQTEHLAFPLPLRDFVAMGRYPHLGPLRPEGAADREAIQEAMARCDILDLAARDVTTLSGGELQRARIARALAQEPQSLALDEPTASLDIRHEMTIFRLLRNSADRGMTVLLITHNINLAARFADRFLLLADGRVAAEGGADGVFREDVLEAVYRWPVAVGVDPSSGAPTVTPLQEPAAS